MKKIIEKKISDLEEEIFKLNINYDCQEFNRKILIKKRKDILFVLNEMLPFACRQSDLMHKMYKALLKIQMKQDVPELNDIISAARWEIK